MSRQRALSFWKTILTFVQLYVFCIHFHKEWAQSSLHVDPTNCWVQVLMNLEVKAPSFRQNITLVGCSLYRIIGVRGQHRYCHRKWHLFRSVDDQLAVVADLWANGWWSHEMSPFSHLTITYPQPHLWNSIYEITTQQFRYTCSH